MRARITIRFSVLVATLFCVALYSTGCGSLSAYRQAPERPYDLWMAALQGKEGPVYYVGGEGEYSYFRAGKVVYNRYKARTSKIHLPSTFPLGHGKPYRVTQEMVLYD
jgi:hypothetical protein